MTRVRRTPTGWIPRSLVLLAVLAGCNIPVQRNDWSAYDGPGAAYFQAEEYTLPYRADPLEPFNRIVLGVNHLVIAYVVNPLSVAWRFVVPQVARDHLVNAADNLGYPGRAVNNVLQGRFEQAGNETVRFAVNSTVGVLGLFDPASEWGIPPAPTDTGMTLNRWGWRSSPYLGLPLAGPSTVRDGIGRLGDTALDPCTYFFPAGPIKAFIVGSEGIESYLRFVDTSHDAYEPGRRLWMVSREIRDTRFEWEREDPGAAGETARAVLLSCRDPWFPYRRRTGRVDIPATGRALAYEAWMQPQPAPVVYIVPGLGTHRRSSHSMALAELVFERGCSAVTVSSSMNFDFMRTAATVPLPGYVPADAADVSAALAAIDGDLQRRHPQRVTARALLGTSLGGFQALWIAATAADGLVFDRVVAVNPPVNMKHAVERIDACYNVALELPPLQREAWTVQALQRAIGAGLGEAEPSAGYRILGRREAEFLIGMSFRIQLHDVLWVSQERHDLGVLRTQRRPLQRAPATQEILDYSYAEYFYGFVLPYFLKNDPEVTSEDDAFERLDLRTVADGLGAHPGVYLVSNENDFLLRAEDMRWAREVLGERCTLFPSGGHLGNLDDPAFRDSILRCLAGLNGLTTEPPDNGGS